MSLRMERANSEILKALSQIISQMNDPRIQKIVSISDVSISPDFRSAKVKVSVLEQKDAQDVVKVLQKSEGFIKHQLAQMVSMPAVPKLIFVVDKSSENVQRVEEILRSLSLDKDEQTEE